MPSLLPNRTCGRAGIAIGPILFVVAILAILATAIAAGSSTFATSTGGEAQRVNSAALIQIGQNLKIGVDRITALGTPITSVVINAVNTVNTVDLFAPTGGGLVAPSSTLSLNGNDPWVYTYSAVTNLGTSAVERLAMLKVSQGVCAQANSQAGNTGTVAADMGNGIDAGTNISATWPAGLEGKMTGCVDNTNGSGHTYYFYQVLGVQ
jgi:hypothetical protein